jgi:hypothetical protein
MPHELTSPGGDLTSERWPDPFKVASLSGPCRLRMIMNVFISRLLSTTATQASEPLMVGRMTNKKTNSKEKILFRHLPRGKLKQVKLSP